MDQDLWPRTLRETIRGSLKIGHALQSEYTAQGSRHNVAGSGRRPGHRRGRQPDYSDVSGPLAKAESSSARSRMPQNHTIRTVGSGGFLDECLGALEQAKRFVR